MLQLRVKIDCNDLFMTTFLFWNVQINIDHIKLLLLFMAATLFIKTFISISTGIDILFIILVEVGLSNKAFLIVGQVLSLALQKDHLLSKIWSTSKQRTVNRLGANMNFSLYASFIPSPLLSFLISQFSLNNSSNSEYAFLQIFAPKGTILIEKQFSRFQKSFPWEIIL